MLIININVIIIMYFFNDTWISILFFVLSNIQISKRFKRNSALFGLRTRDNELIADCGTKLRKKIITRCRIITVNRKQNGIKYFI